MSMDDLPERLERIAEPKQYGNLGYTAAEDVRAAAARIRELEAERDDLKRAWLGAIEADNKRNGALLNLYREAPPMTDRCPTCESGTPVFTRIGYPGRCPDPWHHWPTCPSCGGTDRGVRDIPGSLPGDGVCPDVWHDDDDLRIRVLGQWKAEATTVMNDWLNVWKALGRPGVLGESLAHASEQEVARIISLGNDLADFARGHMLDGPPIDAWDER